MIAVMSDRPVETTEVLTFEPLTEEEDLFALAVAECNGNLKEAFITAFGDNHKAPLAQARILAGKPSVAARIQQIIFAGNDHQLISQSAHLAELAEIRDISKKIGAVKVAFSAEKARGEVAGFYKSADGLEGLDLELARDAGKLGKFVQDTMTKLADSLPV